MNDENERLSALVADVLKLNRPDKPDVRSELAGVAGSAPTTEPSPADKFAWIKWRLTATRCSLSEAYHAWPGSKPNGPDEQRHASR